MAYMCKFYGECDACGYCSTVEKERTNQESEVFYDEK